ncbi:MAG: chemotaxis protein CheW [Myxococcota bacterium]
MQNTAANVADMAMRASAASALGEQVLTFLLGDEEYGVDILRVQEIRGWDCATPIPNTPDFVLGVINLRGTIVPIVDLRLRLGMPSRAYGPTTVVIVLKVISPSRDRTMGVVVDAVSDVHAMTASDVRTSSGLANVDVAFVQGLATVADKMLIIVDVDELLNSGELAERRADAS